jgi:hypothetical protein
MSQRMDLPALNTKKQTDGFFLALFVSLKIKRKRQFNAVDGKKNQ